MAINTASNIMLTDSKTGEAAILKALPIELGDDGSIIIKVNGITTLSDATDRLDLDETKNVAATPKAVASILSEQLGNYIEDVIKEGGGLKVDSDGKIYVDFSGMSSSDLTSLIKQIISETGGLTVDENGQIVVDFSQMSKEELSELVEQIIASNGGLVTDSNGKIVIDFSKLSESQVTDLSETIVQEGGGLAVDENGQIYVDFSTMPTDKFEAMLQSIRVPIWLEKSTNFYVDGTNGSDDNDGSSSSKAFKSVDTCIQYIADNYNLGNYNAFVVISPGEYFTDYKEAYHVYTMPSFTAGTGKIIIQGNPNTTHAAGEVILYTQIATSSYCNYDFRDVTLKPYVPTTQGVNTDLILVQKYSTVNFYNLILDVSNVYDSSSLTTSYVRHLFRGENYGYLRIYASNSAETKSGVTIDFGSGRENLTAYFFSLSQSTLEVTADITLKGTANLQSGRFFSASDLSTASWVTSTFSDPGRAPEISTDDFTFSNLRRYYVEKNSTCSVNGNGTEFFPGDSAGTTSSGGQYV